MSFLALLKVWLIILPFMIVNGMVREAAIRPLAGGAAAEVLSAAIAAAILFFITRWRLYALAGQPTGELLKASATLVLLTVAFEFLFGHYVDRKSWSALVANYELWDGHLWPLVLAILAAMPFVWGHWSRERRHVP